MKPSSADANSNISRWVAFLVSPLIALLAGFVALQAKAWFNLDVDPAEVAAYVTGIVLTVAGLGVTWLHNRGKYEIAKATGATPELVDTVTKVIEEKLPQAPQAPSPGAGSPASPRAPGGGVGQG